MRPLYAYTIVRKPSESSPLEVTVGIHEGMFQGADHLAIQAAVDYVCRRGGGTVRILPGEYLLRNAVFLDSSINLLGSGPQTILRKQATSQIPLADDLDWYGWKTTIADASAYRVGDGITISSQREDAPKTMQVSRHTIVRVDGNDLHLDSQPRLNHWTHLDAQLVSTHSLLEAQRAADIHIADLRLEGNRPAAALLDGNYGGAIFLHDCEQVDIRNVHIHDFNGDAISFQICHDVHIEDCVIDSAAVLAMHPGSGSQRPVMRRNIVRNCTDGIFWCWGVKNGVAEENEISNCSRNGISTGHHDTDNLIRNNRLSGCKASGIFFRPERSAPQTSHRVVVEGNTVTVPDDPKTATGIALTRGVEDVVLRHNRVIVPSGQKERAIIIDPQAIRPVVEHNEVEQR